MRSLPLVVHQRLSRSFCRSSQRTFSTTELDQVCELAASNLRFGPGGTAEVGYDLKDHFGCRRVAVFTDSTVVELDCMRVLQQSLAENQLEYCLFDQVRIEPNEHSFQHAIEWLSNERYDAVVALGGGSVIDTAKAANLYACHAPISFYDYVNPPLGLGKPIPGPCKPLIAIPTTAGTGSETTGVCIFDDTATKSKTGIANRHLKPTLGIVDPNNTATMPKAVATFSGLDVLCHAIESYTALPFNKRAKPTTPIHRPAYQGSNPISDVWSLFALETTACNLRRAVSSPHDQDARAAMLLASSAAGMGFGNAGVHLCHGMSYPIASQVKTYKGYEHVDHPMVPHGHSVIVAAPAVFSFTGAADPVRHATCARILYKARTNSEPAKDDWADAGRWLADEISHLCDDLQVTMGLRRLGYTEEDVPALVEGTVPQHRVTKISPRPVGRKELEALFLDALDE